jgi:hypothetical protein
MNVNHDMVRDLRNVLAIYKKCSFENIKAEEALAFSASFNNVAKLIKDIENELTEIEETAEYAHQRL